MTFDDARPAPALLEVVAGCHKLLDGLDATTRSKAIKMILLAFDETSEGAPARGSGGVFASAGAESEAEQPAGRLNRRSQNWLKKHGLDDNILERVLDLDGDYSLVAQLPSERKREQAISCYLITGVQAMLRTGEPKFRDEDAVALCKIEGCYDRPNHAATRAQLGKRVTGDKESGFTLTSAGLEQAAALLKKVTA